MAAFSRFSKHSVSLYIEMQIRMFLVGIEVKVFKWMIVKSGFWFLSERGQFCILRLQTARDLEIDNECLMEFMLKH